MPWTTEYLPEDKIVLTISSGRLDIKTYVKMATAAHFAAVEKNGTKFLDDHRNAEPAAEIVD